jgi:polyhydroxybutyrate depolymerase
MRHSLALAFIASAGLLVACGGGSSGPASGGDAANAGEAGPDGAADATVSGDAGRDAVSDGASGDGGITDGAPPSEASDGEAGPCTGKTTARRGLTSRSMTVAGFRRTYLVYLPQTLDPNKPAPLVFVMHGYTMSGQDMYNITGYPALADREGVAVAFPDGETGPNSLGAPWNVGTGVCGFGAAEEATGDDFSFVVAVRADIETDQCVDAAHVFVVGFSMGGYFANHLGCMRPDLARAVAAHSGGTHDFGACVPGHKPVILFHGTADPVIAESCGTQARDYWVTKNGCTGGVQSTAVDGGSCEYSLGCPPDGQVVLCLFNGLGHAWAGGAPNQPASDPNYASATELQWAFFKTYAW